jgi:hypothetical protein
MLPTAGIRRYCARGMNRAHDLARVGIIAVCLGMSLSAGPAWSHEARFGLAGKKLLLKAKAGKAKFRFVAQGESLRIGHDPSTVASWLLVRGTGETPGTTGKIEFDSSKWRPIGTSSIPKGYEYRDASRGRGGVKRSS